MHIFEFWCQNLVLGLWFWLKNSNMITREGRSFCKTIGNNDFSYCNSGKEEPLIFLGHFIRLWFNEFLQENMAWSFIEDFLMRMTFLLRGRNWRISNFMPRNFTKLRFYQNPSGYNVKSFQDLSRDLQSSPWICDWPKQSNHRAGFRIDWSAAQIHGGIFKMIWHVTSIIICKVYSSDHYKFELERFFILSG